MTRHIPNGNAPLPDGGRIKIRAEGIAIDHANGDEVVYWDSAEWEEPECAQAIIRVLLLAVTKGAQACCDQIGRCQSCREREKED